jgi:hypothetical protein
MLSLMKKHAAALVVAGLGLGGGAAAYAADSPSRPTVSLDQAAAAASPDGLGSLGSQAGAGAQAGVESGRRGRAGRARRAEMALLRRTVHGDLVVRTKDGFQHVTYDRGKLASASGNTLTVTRPDGATVTVTVNDQTKYRGVSGFAQLQTGRATLVLSKDGVAVLVAQPNRDRAPASAPPAA